MYEKYTFLRDRDGLSDYAVSKGTRISRSTLSEWGRKRDSISKENIERLASFFNVPVSYFYDDTDISVSSVTGDKFYFSNETAETAQMLYENPDLRMLFDAAKDSRPEDLLLAADMLRRLKGTRNE